MAENWIESNPSQKPVVGLISAWIKSNISRLKVSSSGQVPLKV